MKKLLIILGKTILVLGIFIAMFALWGSALQTKNEFLINLSSILLVIGSFFVFVLGIMFGINPAKNEFRKFSNYKKISNIKIPENMKNTLENILLEKQNMFKDYRKQLKQNIIISVFIAITMIIIFFKMVVANKNDLVGIQDFGGVLLEIGIIILGIFVISFFDLKKKFVKDYKSFVISKVVNALSYDLNYDENGNKEIGNKYMSAKFNDLYRVGHFKTTDYICGNISDDVKLEVCQMELLTEGKSKFDSFMFSCAETKMNISDMIKIKNKEILVDEKMVMDNMSFIDYFDVISKNEILAMQLLTHDTMEVIIKLYEEYEIPFEMILKENKIFVKFYTGKIFEPKVFGEKNEIKRLWKYCCVIKAITEFVTKISNQVEKTF